MKGGGGWCCSSHFSHWKSFAACSCINFVCYLIALSYTHSFMHLSITVRKGKFRREESSLWFRVKVDHFIRIAWGM